MVDIGISMCKAESTHLLGNLDDWKRGGLVAVSRIERETRGL